MFLFPGIGLIWCGKYWRLVIWVTLPFSYVISGTYIDKKCPFTGTVSIRGRILAGTCHSAKMVRTIIVRRNYLHFVKKYQRFVWVSFSVSISLYYLANFFSSILLLAADMRRGTPTSLPTSRHASVWRKEIMWSLANAGDLSIKRPSHLMLSCASFTLAHMLVYF